MKRKIALFLPRSDKVEYFWGKFKGSVNDFLNVKNYVSQLALTDEEYNEPQQNQIIENFVWRNVSGAIVAPAGPSVLNTIANISNKQRVPLVLHDITPEDHDKFFSKKDIPAPLYVTIDNKLGGQIAAEIMFNFLTKEKKIQLPYTILIIPGNNKQTHSKNRIEGFQRTLLQKTKSHVMFCMTEDGNWNYDDCLKVITDFIDNVLPNLPIEEIHGIFACNDEMAICVNKVIDDKIKSSYPFKDKLANSIIIGFDATKEIIREIKNPRSRIVGTVDAKIEEQAKRVANLIISLIEDKKSKQRWEKHRDQLTVKPEPKI
ncbi:MAG: sugar ABC transporter substrate-binding protein [Candidatus Lokiarchaeia archaeon]